MWQQFLEESVAVAYETLNGPCETDSEETLQISKLTHQRRALNIGTVRTLVYIIPCFREPSCAL